jgi:hypothetical protein
MPEVKIIETRILSLYHAQAGKPVEHISVSYFWFLVFWIVCVIVTGRYAMLGERAGLRNRVARGQHHIP